MNNEYICNIRLILIDLGSSHCFWAAPFGYNKEIERNYG